MSLKAFKKPYRSLAGLERTSSTSRVLNLAALARVHGERPEHAARPFLRNPQLNRSLILKHRLRAEDGDMAGAHVRRRSATKVILPFEPSNLGLGGSALFVGQPGWQDLLAQIGGPGRRQDVEHDRAVLEALDELPSLDPFLLREHLRRRGLRIADCYFDLPPRDLERMRSFVTGAVAPLVSLVQRDGARSHASAAKLARILLSSHPEQGLQPLSETLRLEGEAYAEGVHAWKGFLYYKWLMACLADPLEEVVTEIARVRPQDAPDADVAGLIATFRSRLRQSIPARRRDVAVLIGRYDEAFRRLTLHGDARAFRDFLLDSPVLFLELGERTGVLSHVATFWRYRFPVDSPLIARAEDLLDILQEFETSLAQAPLYLDAA